MEEQSLDPRGANEALLLGIVQDNKDTESARLTGNRSSCCGP